MGHLAYERNDYQAALNHYDHALELDPENSNYLNDAGITASTLKEYDKAIEYHEKALESDLNNFGPENPFVSIRWTNLGFVWKGKGDHDKAIELFQKALANDLKTYRPEHPLVALALNNLGGAG